MVKQLAPAKRKASSNDTSPSGLPRLRPSKKPKLNSAASIANVSPSTPKSKQYVLRNADAGPSTRLEPSSSVSVRRMSSRVSQPTSKKVAATAQTAKKKTGPPRISVEDPLSSDSDSLPPGILPSPLKKQTPSTSPNKPEPTSKHKVVHLGAFELSSSDNDVTSTRQPPRKRIKTSIKPDKTSKIIDLCSDDDVQPKKALPTRQGLRPSSNFSRKITPRDKVRPTEQDVSKKVVPNKLSPKKISPRKKDAESKNLVSLPKDVEFIVLSTDEEDESSLARERNLSASNKDPDSGPRKVITETLDTDLYRSPSGAGGQESPPIVDCSKFSTPNSSLPPTTFISSRDDPATDLKDVSLNSLQKSYKEAMDKPASSPFDQRGQHCFAFTSVRFSPPTRTITFSSVPSAITLHTPLYFSRSIASITDSPKPSQTPATTAPMANSTASIDLSNALESAEDEIAPSSSVPAPKESASMRKKSDSPSSELGGAVKDPLLVSPSIRPDSDDGLSTAELSITLENVPMLVGDPQVRILNTLNTPDISSGGPTLENNTLGDHVHQTLNKLEPESSFSDPIAYVSVQEAYMSIDTPTPCRGRVDKPDEIMLLTTLDDATAVKSITSELDAPSAITETSNVSASAPMRSYTPPLPNFDMRVFRLSPYGSAAGPVLLTQGQISLTRSPTVAESSAVATRQSSLPCQVPETSVQVERIQESDDPVCEASYFVFEKEARLEDESHQSIDSPVSVAKSNALLSTDPLSNTALTPIRSPTSNHDSRSPATPVQQCSAEPLIWTEPSGQAPDALPISDIDMSKISITWLMNGCKADESEDDDDISGLEFMYPEEIF